LRYYPLVRSYQQFCPAARALDVVGERWALLVVRELLYGPKRYTDLQDGLPRIGPNVLADRLRSLESAGVVEKQRLPPPAASTVYKLTERGEGLRPVLSELFRWGLQLLDAPAGDEALRASYWLPAIEAAASLGPSAAEFDDTYEFRIGEEIVTVVVSSGQIDVRQGPAESPDLVLEVDPETFSQLGMGRVSAEQCVEAGTLSVDGDRGAAQRCAALFALAGTDRQPVSA
jgi:DNA-binding HxlR family transcriptional regulator/putative sterol carrier protein